MIAFHLQNHQDAAVKPSLSLSGGGLQKKVKFVDVNDSQKGITRKGLGGKKIGVNTTIEPMAEKKPVAETVRVCICYYHQKSKYGSSLVLEKVIGVLVELYIET